MDLPVERSRERIFNIPPVVAGLVAALTAIHLLMAFVLPMDESEALLDLFAFDPLRYGASGAGEALPGGMGADVWTFVTYAFFHLNLIHLGFNLIWLVAFGTPVARRFGAARFLAFFAFTAAAGAFAHLITHLGQNVPAIGASAAVLGMMAAALRFVFEPNGPLGEHAAYEVPAKPLIAMLRDRRMILFVLAWFALNAVVALPQFAMPGVDAAVAWQAHVGGFVAGLVGFSAFDPVRPLPRYAEAPEVGPDPNPPVPDEHTPATQDDPSTQP
jgi:membrane associated rhomboid family serine protease